MADDQWERICKAFEAWEETGEWRLPVSREAFEEHRLLTPEKRAARERRTARTEAMKLSGAQREWQYLRIRAADMEVDLASALAEVEDDSDTRAAPYGRWKRALEEAQDLLDGECADGLADAARAELEYVRRCLDEYWALDRQAAVQRTWADEQEVRERQRDAETRAYRDRSLPTSGSHVRPSLAQQLEEDYQRTRHPGFRLPDEGM
ncbi:hypothetical protein [Streptomyces sp. IBSBF 3136]|uniref:hypothetical protein n=1 Tax=Streptomyces sp. IBSBF 3136 TaxID=2903524 RepID=UPI002FDC3AFA